MNYLLNRSESKYRIISKGTYYSLTKKLKGIIYSNYAMRIFLLTFFLYPIICFSQQDANGWFLANTGVDGTRNYIKNLEKKSSDIFTCWIKMVSPVKKSKKGVKIGGGYSIQYWTLYCGDNQYSVSETVTYNSKGNPIDSYDRSYEGVKNVIPDSVAEGILLLVCDAGKLIQD